MYKLIRITTVPESLKGLLKGQLKFMSNYFEVVAVSGGGEMLENVEIEEGVRTESIKMQRNISIFSDLISLIMLIRLFQKEKPEIVHTHTPKAGFLGMIAAWITKVPIRMHTVAGMPLMESLGIKRKILNVAEKITYKCAHKIYPNSNGLLRFIIENNFSNPKKLKLIGNGSSNGINLEYFNPINVSETLINKLQIEYKISKQDFVFIFIGRVVKDKGIEELVSAFDRLSLESSRVKLFIVGEYEDKLDPVSSEIKKIIIHNDSIIYTGHQTDVRPFLKISNVLVHPSYREGFPNVVMQGCAFNLPCIVTDINGSNEIIQHNHNGLVVHTKDSNSLYECMKIVYRDSKLVEELSRNSRKLISEKYDQKFIWNELLKEYNYLINLKENDS